MLTGSCTQNRSIIIDAPLPVVEERRNPFIGNFSSLLGDDGKTCRQCSRTPMRYVQYIYTYTYVYSIHYRTKPLYASDGGMTQRYGTCAVGK